MVDTFFYKVVVVLFIIIFNLEILICFLLPKTSFFFTKTFGNSTFFQTNDF